MASLPLWRVYLQWYGAPVLGESLRQRRSDLLARTDLRGVEFTQEYARAADEWLREIAITVTGDNSRNLVLVALGEYGQGELAPFSDLNLVLVHGGRFRVRAAAERLWNPIWDEDIHVNHAVRSRRELLQMEDAEVSTAVDLLTARVVWGDESVLRPVTSALSERWAAPTGTQRLSNLRHQADARHGQLGDLSEHVEPDLVEDHGGLRDGQFAQALANRRPEFAPVRNGPGLADALATLTAVRVALQVVASRSTNCLFEQYQALVATRVGVGTPKDLLSLVAESGVLVAKVTDECWRATPQSGATQ
jgi:[protein-PII] uridylyltransferase